MSSVSSNARSMGKKQPMETEVREAVRDYLQELIGDRSGAGKGMAVSANDLMVAAKSSGYKANRTEASKMLDNLLEKNRPPPSPPKHAAKQPGYMNATRASRCKSAELQTDDAEKRPKSDLNKYHWMIWKTGLTPQPTTPDTPDRPDTAASMRPPSAASILRPPTATPYRPSTQERSYTPYEPGMDDEEDELAEISCRNPTPDAGSYFQAVDRPAPPTCTPCNIDPYQRDFIASTVPGPDITRKNTNGNSNLNSAYMPNLHAWVNNANDYEKAVAYNLLKALGGGNPDPPTIPRAPKQRQPVKFEFRPKSAPPAKPRALGRQRIQRQPTAGVRTCIPMWKIYEQADKLNIKDNPYSMQAVRGPVPPVPYKDYIHEGSCFMLANRPYRNDFTINPEWVSEEKVRKKNSQKAFKSSFVVHPEWVSESAPATNLRHKQLEAQMKMTKQERL